MKKKSSLWVLMMILAAALAFGGCSDNGSASGDNEDTQTEQRDLDRDGGNDDKSNGTRDDNKKKDTPADGTSEDQQPGSAADDKKDTSTGGASEDQQPGSAADDKKDAPDDGASGDRQPGSETEDRKVQGSEKNLLVGTWVSEPIDALAHEFVRGMGDLGEYEEYLAVDESKIIFRFRFVFDEEGNVSASLDEKSYNETIDYVLDTMEAGMKKYIEDMLESAGLDMSVDDFMAMIGTTWDEFHKETRESAYNGIDTDSMGQVSVYEVRDGRIFMAGSKAELARGDSLSFEVSADKLTFIAYYNVDGEPVEDSVWGGILKMPMVFQRQ